MSSVSNEKKIGLVLEGGAMRGMFTAGVLDAFMEYGLKPDLFVGVSAGALFGVNYLSGQKGRAIRYNSRFNKDRNYLGIKPFLKEGNIVSTEYAYHRVPHELDPFDNEAYKANPAKFYAVITELSTAKPEYVHVKDVFEQMDVLRASGSMPVVSKPVIINEKEYLDGALGDNIPFNWMINQGVDKVVVILTRAITYKKKPMAKIMCNLYKKKYPLFSKAMEDRHLYYNSQIEELKKLEKEGKAFVIRPSMEIKISRTERNAKKLREVYELGQKDAADCYDNLMMYLNK
ncbi:MAG: patatin family protein [Bacilli bacterium]|nr:patatin family protein [Bacilli bacterium]